MDAKANFDQSFYYTKRFLLISGIQIEKSPNRLVNFSMKWFFYLCQAWLYWDILGEIFFIIDAEDGAKTFYEISPLIPCITISILGTVKAAPLYYQSDVLINILKELQEIHPNVATDIKPDEVSEEQEIARDAVTNFSKVIRLFLVMTLLVVIPFCFVPSVLMAYDHFTLGVTDVKFPFAVKYFFDATKPMVWPFVYTHQVLSSECEIVLWFNFNLIKI